MDIKRFRECAEAYLSLGWQIIPLCYPDQGQCTCGRGCKKPGKAPHYRLCPQGSHQGTADMAEVSRWFDSGERFNLGIVTGQASGIVVVDVDTEKDGHEAWGKLTGGRRQETATVQTGSGGGHFYYRCPAYPVRNSSGRLGKGIDVRGEGGYVVAPPSIHANGNEYRWRIDPRSGLAPMPPWVTCAQINQPSVLTGNEPIPEGRRDDTLIRIGGKLRRSGLSVDDIYLHLSLVNQKRCQPPLPDKDIQRIAKSAGRYEPKAEEDDAVMLPDSSYTTIARVFENQSEYKHKYHPTVGWAMYKDGQYQSIDQDTQLARYVSVFMSRCVCQDGKHIKRIPVSISSVQNVIFQLRFLADVYLYPEKQYPPCWLDGRGDSTYIIPVRNGLLDWSDWPPRLLPPTPDFYTTTYLPFAWQEETRCDLWDRFLVDATQGDTELMILLQQWAGYCLMKHDNKQQKFLLIHGESGTGKSVFSDIMTYLVGQNNTSTVRLSLFADTHAITQTYGKMLNVCDETEESLLDPQAENALKHYTGGGLFPFKFLYKQAFSARPTAKVMITTNHLPKFKDSSEGVWRRMLLCPFNHVVERPIKDLVDRIVADEMPGVLAWALHGAKMLIDKGQFIEPVVSREMLYQYKLDQHPERQFLIENFEAIEFDDAAEHAAPLCKQVRKAYEAFCKDNNFGVKNETNFGKCVRKLFPTVRRQRVWRNDCRQYAYVGLKVKPDSEYYNMIEMSLWQ